MRLLDLYCGAGGAGMGYHRAGFEVVGVDIAAQPNYPFEFHRADALEFVAEHGREFDVVHASPPCQNENLTALGHLHKHKRQYREAHPNLIPKTRELLMEIGRPYVIENVEGAADFMINPLMLCGSMFGLKTGYGNPLYRHRLFETSPAIWFPPAACMHHRDKFAIGVHGGGQHPLRQSKARSTGRKSAGQFGVDQRRIAMGIEWMSGKELNQAIPPAYTEYLGRQLLRVLEAVTE